MFRLMFQRMPVVLPGLFPLCVAVIKWPDVSLWPEVCPDVMVDAAIGDTDFLLDFICAEVFAEVGQDGVWGVRVSNV